MDASVVLSSDFLLAFLLSIVAFYFTYKSVPSSTLNDAWSVITGRPPPALSTATFSLPQAYNGYLAYAKLSNAELIRMRVATSMLPRPHKRLAFELGYTRKLDRLQDAINANAKVAQAIAGHAATEHMSELGALSAHAESTPSELGRVREALKHLVRDWSAEGRAEREAAFQPILDVLRSSPQDHRHQRRVLVPGAGLGRLAWEISQLGFDTTANELSCFMTLPMRYLLSPSTTNEPEQHSVQPYAHWFSHQRSSNVLFRAISFPDVVPRLSSTFHLAEADFFSLTPPSSDSEAPGYDYIVTLFFIDTSLNVIATIEHIYSLLRPGGKWINLGPLLWTLGAQAKVELSLEEVLQVAEHAGFVFESSKDGSRTRTVNCEYTADREAMMRWVYEAELWVASKKS
ncbi:hypothetical protein HGRIS_001730 [Hohenbuehelia grisea]|uniref:N2227-domain-containing protein n=1 Tax=Hohenbuehelia grisea TaxID=104357 RepID=A0ABR3JIA8_9AGAR